MNWNRTETVGLANPKCAHCRGIGLLLSRQGLVPCRCVLRKIFRRCYNRFRSAVLKCGGCTKSSMEYTAGRDGRFCWGRKDEEFVADFLLVSRRSLSQDEYDIFNYHYLLGADWRLCCRRLDLERGAFFHEVYRIEEKLGRIYRELQPYSLFPLDEYFFGSTSEWDRRIEALPLRDPVRPLKPHQVIPIPRRKAA